MADSMENLKKMKVPELKQALKDRGLACTGTKPDLIKRLAEAMGAPVEDSGAALGEGLEGIDDEILNDDPVPAAAPAQAPASPTKSTAPVTSTSQTATTLPTTTASEDVTSKNGLSQTSTTVPETAADPNTLAKPEAVRKLTEAERLKMRADKFGATSENAKKELRAQRFGISDGGDSKPGAIAPVKSNEGDLEKMKKRAERFGAVTSTSLSKLTEEEKKRKRAERFGVASLSTSTVKTSISLNSVDSELEAKKRKRAERFGLAS